MRMAHAWPWLWYSARLEMMIFFFFPFCEWSGSLLYLLCLLFTLWFNVHAFFFFFFTSKSRGGCFGKYFPAFIRGHVYKAFIYEQLAGPLSAASVWRWLGGLSERSGRAGERETPFHLFFLFSSADLYLAVSRPENPPWHESEFWPLHKKKSDRRG